MKPRGEETTTRAVPPETAAPGTPAPLAMAAQLKVEGAEAGATCGDRTEGDDRPLAGSPVPVPLEGLGSTGPAPPVLLLPPRRGPGPGLGWMVANASLTRAASWRMGVGSTVARHSHWEVGDVDPPLQKVCSGEGDHDGPAAEGSGDGRGVADGPREDAHPLCLGLEPGSHRACMGQDSPYQPAVDMVCAANGLQTMGSGQEQDAGTSRSGGGPNAQGWGVSIEL